jgi:hypothetical protein
MSLNKMAVSLFFAALIIQRAPSFSVPQKQEHVTTQITTALVQAIEDEIYVRGYEKKFADVGEPDGPNRHRLPLYVQPSLKDGRAWVIYKLMPYGEIYRMFYVQSDGLVILHGRPDNGFPPTQPDYLTVYMDDDDLCNYKSHWIKSSFVVDTSVSQDRVDQARVRENKRKEQLH